MNDLPVGTRLRIIEWVDNDEPLIPPGTEGTVVGQWNWTKFDNGIMLAVLPKDCFQILNS